MAIIHKTRVQKGENAQNEGSKTKTISSSQSQVMQHKVAKSNSTLIGQKQSQNQGTNSLQSFNKEKVPMLNFNKIKFSENLKGEADIQVIKEDGGSKSHFVHKKGKIFTHRLSPRHTKNGKSVEYR